MKKSIDMHLGLDANGMPTETFTIGSERVVVHYDDIPESDITVVRGMRCTTPIRTVIDLAAELRPAELETVMNDCLNRGLFTLEDMTARLAKPDMTGRRGAEIVRSHIDTGRQVRRGI